MADWIGRTLGQVRIESYLARGGMAEVYLGTHTALQRRVAVKILHAQFLDDLRFLERFQREARAVAMLRHPNIVQVYDFNLIDGQPYLVMEYLPGGTLSTHLFALSGSNHQLELPVVNRLLTSMAGALQYAHDRGVIHRDIKPGNILMTSRIGQMTIGSSLPADTEPVITDFGLVRLLNSSSQTATLQVAGTPAYMSPEQAKGEQTDERTDIYSLGIVTYEMLAGRLPFEAETTVALLLKHVNEPPPSISGLTPAIQNVIDHALAKDKADRFATPLEFATSFSEALEGRIAPYAIAPVKSTASRLPAIRGPRKMARRTWLAAAGVVVSLLVLGSYLTIGSTLPRATPSATTTNTIPVETPTAQPSATYVAPLLGPTGILHFRDGTAIMDQAEVIAMAMPAPPSGGQYEVWLIGGKERLSVGILTLDTTGKGKISFTDSQGRNLLGIYNEVEITIEPVPDTSVKPSTQVAFTFSLPDRALEHVRHLLVTFPGTPDEKALIQGLFSQSELIAQAAEEMLGNYQNGDEAGARLAAESLLNILVGNQSADYRDWNEDGQITDPGDGYGMLLNGGNSGYIQAVYANADYAATTPDATQYMVMHGEHVKVCAQNLQQWASLLHDLVLDILNSPGPDLESSIHAASALADLILNGADLDKNNVIDPISGECGAATAHEHAYSMADISLLPGGATPTPNAAAQTANAPGAGGPAGTSPPNPKPTKKDVQPPGQQKTREPPSGPPGEPPGGPPDVVPGHQ